MPMTKQEIDDLLRLLGLTKDEEIDCNQCLSRLAELVELELASPSIPEALKAVEHHLSICAECLEEYEALGRALEAMSPS